MTVRRAITEDITRLIELAREEHAVSRFARLPFDAQRVEESFLAMVNGMGSAVFMSEGGYIVGVVQSMLFNRFWNAYELAWYSKDGSGMALLDALADWAHAMRAVDLVVHNYAGVVAPERFTKVLARRGFSQLGASYVKQIGEV